MPRPLSNIEYATFLSDVQPDSLGLPDWGGIAQWGGEYVLMFKMPSGEWALSDISDGIPSAAGTIMPADYLRNVPVYQPSGLEVFIYSLPQNFMASALQTTAAAGALASGVVTWTAEQVANAIKPILAAGIPIGPIAVAALVLLALIYLPKPRQA
jgi:hypothetical protein